MPITIKCPHCGEKTGGIPDKFRGKSGKCPKCDTKLFVDHCEVREARFDSSGDTQIDGITDNLPVPQRAEIPGRSTANTIGGFGLLISIGIGAVAAMNAYWQAVGNNIPKDEAYFFPLIVFLVVAAAVYLPFMGLASIVSLLGSILQELRR